MFDKVASHPMSLYLSGNPETHLEASQDSRIDRKKKKRRAADAGVKKFSGTHCSCNDFYFYYFCELDAVQIH